MPVIFKPGVRTWGSTEHLKDEKPTDHRDVLDYVWKFRSKSPDTNAFINSMSQFQKWGALDQDTFHRAMGGSIGGKDVKLVSMMPPAVAALLHLYYPEVLKDKNEFYKLLKRHPEWRVAGGWKF